MGLHERLNCACALVQGVAQVTSPEIAGLDDVAQGYGVSRELRTDRSTQEAVVMKDADFGHVTGVIPNDDGLPHIGRQGGIEVAKGLEPNAPSALAAAHLFHCGAPDDTARE